MALLYQYEQALIRPPLLRAFRQRVHGQIPLRKVWQQTGAKLCAEALL
jgi:hypothetical protein